MKIFIPNIVRSSKTKFDAGIKDLRSKRESWEKMSGNAIDYFNELKEECEKQKLFECIYVIDSRKQFHTKDNLPLISIFFGQHPLGYTEFNSNNMTAEGGCTLTIAQTIFGDVVCTYSPFESSLAKMNEEYIIARIYHAPWGLTDSELDSLTKKLFSYAVVSSIYGNSCLLDRNRVRFMRLHHWWLHFRISNVILKLIGKASEEGVKNAIGA